MASVLRDPYLSQFNALVIIIIIAITSEKKKRVKKKNKIYLCDNYYVNSRCDSTSVDYVKCTQQWRNNKYTTTFLPAILVIFFTQSLHYSDDTATIIYHAFSMLVYFCPLLGAIIADSWLGKFRTIFYLSLVYAAGQLLLSASAIPTLDFLPPR